MMMSQKQPMTEMPTTYDPKAAETKWYPLLDGRRSFLKRASALREAVYDRYSASERNGHAAYWACA